ncbi:MAG: hypothetical protein JSU06_14200 [Actinobacteria bacterium]|nr:hypothetical protein [Actinomycetota bacterium]
MRRVGIGFAGIGALVALALALVSVAAAAGNKKLVEGTVYDTTCAAVCVPECPPIPCGPVPSPGPVQGAIVCAQRMIACPLRAAPPHVCLPSGNCGGYPVYTGEGAVVNVRRRGSATVLATLPVSGGHFQIKLAPGEYVFRPSLPEAQCWSGAPVRLAVKPRLRSPVPAAVYVSNRCVVHPYAP